MNIEYAPLQVIPGNVTFVYVICLHIWISLCQMLKITSQARSNMCFSWNLWGDVQLFSGRLSALGTNKDKDTNKKTQTRTHKAKDTNTKTQTVTRSRYNSGSCVAFFWQAVSTWSTQRQCHKHKDTDSDKVKIQLEELCTTQYVSFVRQREPMVCWVPLKLIGSDQSSLSYNYNTLIQGAATDLWGQFFLIF